MCTSRKKKLFFISTDNWGEVTCNNKPMRNYFPNLQLSFTHFGHLTLTLDYFFPPSRSVIFGFFSENSPHESSVDWLFSTQYTGEWLETCLICQWWIGCWKSINDADYENTLRAFNAISNCRCIRSDSQIKRYLAKVVEIVVMANYYAIPLSGLMYSFYSLLGDKG